MLDKDIYKIFDLFRNYQDVEGFVKVATLEEIKKNNYDLNISLYVEPVFEEENITMEEALADFKKAVDECFSAEDNLRVLLKREGLMEWV